MAKVILWVFLLLLIFELGCLAFLLGISVTVLGLVGKNPFSFLASMLHDASFQKRQIH